MGLLFVSILVPSLQVSSLAPFNLFISVAICTGISRVFAGFEFLKSVAFLLGGGGGGGYW